MRIGLLINDSISEFRLKTLIPILNDNSFSVELALIDDSPKKTLMKKLKKHISWGRGGYILIMAFQKLFTSKKSAISAEKFCKEHGIPVYKIKNIYSSETIININTYNLDVLLLIGGYGIIKEPLLSITRLGILSYHHGNMRKYRGMPPVFWEIYNGEKELGVTVQILASGLDCGFPIEEKTIEIKRTDTLKKIRNKALQESTHMMYNALNTLSNNNYIPKKIETLGQVYTLPNLKQWIMFNMKIIRRGIRCSKSRSSKLPNVRSDKNVL